jgi:hypothetical protein
LRAAKGPKKLVSVRLYLVERKKIQVGIRWRDDMEIKG